MYRTQRTTVVDVDIASRQTLNWPVQVSTWTPIYLIQDSMA